MKPTAATSGLPSTKEIHIPKVFQQIRPVPQSLSNQPLAACTEAVSFKFDVKQDDFALFTGDAYRKCKVIAVSFCYSEAKIIINSEILTVNKNQIYEISDKELPTCSPQNFTEPRKRDIFAIEQYEGIELNTLQAKCFRPCEEIEPDTYKDNIAYKLTMKYANVFSAEEIASVFYSGINRLALMSKSEWYCLPGFEWLFTANSVIEVDDLWHYLSNQRFCNMSKLDNPIERSELTHIPNFTIMDARYEPCREVVELLYAYYQNFSAAVLRNENFGDAMDEMNEKYLRIISTVKDEAQRALCQRLLVRFDFSEFKPSMEFERFEMLYVNLTRVIYCSLLKEEFNIDILKAYRMFNSELLNFASVEHINMCQVINSWFDPPTILYDTAELEVMLPYDWKIGDSIEIMLEKNKNHQNGSNEVEEDTSNFSLEQDVRKRNLILLEFLRKLHFFEHEAVHFDRFPIQIGIIFKEEVLSSNEQIIRTEPSISDAVNELKEYLDSITKHMFIFESSEFYEQCKELGYDYYAYLRNEMHNLYPEQETMQEYCLEQCTAPLQVIYEEYLNVNIEQKMFELSSILLLANDIIIDNFTLDEELRLIDDFYSSGLVREIFLFTEEFEKNNALMHDCIKQQSYDNIEIQGFYFLQFYQQVLTDAEMIKRATFKQLISIFEFSVRAKKAFTYLLQDQLYFYCFCIDTGQLDVFFNKFEIECYNNAQERIMNILHRFSAAVIENMRLLLEVVGHFETNPFKFRDLSCVEAVMPPSSFRHFFNNIFGYILVILEEVTRMFGVQMHDLEAIEQSYALLFKLSDYERAYGLKIANLDTGTEFEFHKLVEVQNLRSKELSEFYTSIERITIQQIDEIFNTISAVHRFSCIMSQKYELLNCRKVSYREYIGDLNLVLIDKSAEVMAVIEERLFDDFSAIQLNRQINLELTEIESDLEHIFEEEFIVELESYIHIYISSSNFKDRRERCRDRTYDLICQFIPNTRESKIVLFLSKCRIVEEFLKELLELILIKDQWLECLHISEEHVEEGTMYQMLLMYYENVSLIYNIFMQGTLTNLQFMYQQRLTVRGTNIDGIEETLTLFMQAMMLFRNSQHSFKEFISSESIVFLPEIEFLMNFVVETELNNFRYYYLFISIANKNLSPQEFRSLSSEFNMNVQESLLISVNDIIGSYKSYSSTLFDYCEFINAELIFSTTIYQHVQHIFLKCCSIEVDQDETGEIVFTHENLITYLQNSKVALERYILQYNEYSLNLLQFIRDVEQIINIMLNLFYGINVLEFLLNDLLIIKSHGNIIEIDFKQIEREVIQPEVEFLINKYKEEEEVRLECSSVSGTGIKETVTKVKQLLQDRRKEEENKVTDKINLLNVFEIVSINDGERFLKLFAEKFIKEGNMFIGCVQYFKVPKNENSKFSLKELYKLIAELYEIHDRILLRPYSYLFDKYQKQSSENVMVDNILKEQYQIFKADSYHYLEKTPYERFEEKLLMYEQHETEMQLLENHNYEQNAILLPLIDNHVVFINAAQTAPEFLLYSSFEENIDFVLKSKKYQFESLFNIDNLDIQDSPTRGRIIVSFSSSHEQLLLVRPCRVPTHFCECDTSFKQYLLETIEYKFESAGEFLRHEEYARFLKEPYEIEFLALSMATPAELSGLKMYMESQEIRDEEHIPMANRLLELASLDAKQKFEFEIENKQLFVMPYGIECSFAWGGAPSSHEYREMSEVIYTYVHDILAGFALNKPVILHHAGADTFVTLEITYTLQRILCRCIMRVYLSDSTFTQQFHTLQCYLLAGYIVYIINYQNIRESYRYQIIEFVNEVCEKFGYFSNIYRAALNHNVIKSAIRQKAVEEKNKLLGIEQPPEEKEVIISLDDLKLQEVSIREAHPQLGFMIFDFDNVSNDLKEELFAQFENYHEVELHTQDQLNEFARLNPMLGVAYHNIATIMLFFNNRVEKLTLQQYQMIHNEIADISNPLSNVLLLMDQTMKSYMIGYKRNELRGTLAEGFNNYSFRHEKEIAINMQQDKQTSSKSHLESLINDFELMGNLFSEEMKLSKNDMHEVSNQVKYYCNLIGKLKYNIRTRKSFYNEYIAEFLYNRLNEKTEAFLQQCVHRFEVSIGIAYDIYYVSILLKRETPILLSAINFEYLQFILEVANEITGNNDQLVYIYATQFLERIELHNNAEYVVFVSSQEETNAYIEILHTLGLESYRLNLIFVCASKAEAIYNQFFEYRMSCLGEIKDIIGFKLYLVENIKLVALEELEQLYINEIHKKCSDFTLKLYRIKLMNGTFNGFVVLIFEILCRLFSIGSKADEYAHVRAIFDFFLVQFEVLEISDNNYSFSDEISAFESKMLNPQFDKDIQQHEVQCMTKSCLETTHLLNQEILQDMNGKSIFEVETFYANNIIPGRDEHECFKYQFTESFIEYIILFDTAYEFVNSVVASVVVCMWNAFSLFSEFAQEDVFITKRYQQFYDYLKNFDLEKYICGFEGYYLSETFRFLIYDSDKHHVSLNLIQQKYSTNSEIIKKLMVSISERLPTQFFSKEFCYLNLLANQEQYEWQTYTIGKGILSNISYESFIRFNRQVIAKNASEDQVDAEQDEMVNQSDAEQQVALFMKLQEFEKTNTEGDSRDEVGFSENVDEGLYLEEFDLESMSEHQDIQPIFGKYNCIFLDDERTAMAVLLACGMLSMTSFEVDGSKSSGKTTLIKISGLIVKNMINMQEAVILDPENEHATECFMQSILDNYEVFNEEFVEKCDFAGDEEVEFDHDINMFANETYMLLENELFDNLKEFKFKHDDLETIYRLLTNTEICHEEALFENSTANQSVKTLHLRSLKCIYDRIEVFHVNYNPSENNDRLRELLEFHEILELGQREEELESNLVKISGTLELIDTSFIIESDNGEQPFDIVCYRMPDLSISFLREYLKYYSDYYQLKMTDEWIYSFLNGANLLKGSLPEHIFQSFKFMEIMQRAIMNSLPSYNTIVKESKRYSKHINMSLEEMIQEMEPELWTLLISNYDVLNQQYEKTSDKEFREVLKQMVEYLKISQTKPSYLQRIIALNRDDIFKQANIFSLFYVLNTENASYSCITQCQERITSLTLLGYLNIESVENAVKLCHPWQQFGTLVLKQTINAVLIELNLLQGRQYTTVLQQEQQATNKFANKLFYYMKPLVIDKEYLLEKFPFLKVMRNFADELPSPMSIVFLLEEFLIQNKMKTIFDSGLITSNMYKSNAFYEAHIIEEYGEMASQYEPEFVNYMYEVFIEILERKHRNSSILEQELQVLENGNSSYFTLVNKDMTMNFKMYFVSVISEYLSQERTKSDEAPMGSSRSIRKNESNLSIQYHESDNSESNDEFEETATQDEFEGFTRQAILSCKVPFLEISLNCNSNANSYNNVVSFLSLISQYKVMQAEEFKITMQEMGKSDVELEQSDDQEEQSQYSKGSKASASATSVSMSIASSMTFGTSDVEQFKYNNIQCTELTPREQLYINNIRHDRKIILDVQNIVNLIESYTNKKERQHKKQQTELNADLMEYIRNFVLEIQALESLDDDAIEYLVIIEIIRFSMLMALGIKPYLAFNTSAFSKSSVEYKYNIESLFIGICLQSMLQEYYHSSKLKTGPVSTDSSIQGFSQLLHSRIEQYMEIQSNSAVTMNDVLSGNQFPDLADQTTEFVQEPYDVILIMPKSVLKKQSSSGISLESTIISSFTSNSEMSILFDKNEISTILCLLSINIGLKTELQTELLYTMLSLSYTVIVVNDLQEPAGQTVTDKNEVEVLSEVPNILEDCVSLLEIEAGTQHSQFLQYNIVKYEFEDLRELFRISGCHVPDDSDIFTTHQSNYANCVQEYCFITVNIYSQIKRLIKRSCPNFVEFTELTANIINFITKRISAFFDTFNYIFLAYHFFEALASPCKRQAEMIAPESFIPPPMSSDTTGIPSIVEEEVKLYQEGEVGKHVDFEFMQSIRKIAIEQQTDPYFDAKMLSSTITNHLMRNILYTALEYLKLEFGQQERGAESFWVDGVILACHIIFEQSGLLNSTEIFDYLQRAKFCRTFGNCELTLQTLSQRKCVTESNNVNLFLTYIIANCEEIGICVDMGVRPPDRTEIEFQKFEKRQYTNSNPLVCLNGDESKQCYLRYWHTLGCFSFPIVPLMHFMNTPILEDDPYYELLYNLCVLTHVLSKTTFIVDEKLIALAACLLEMLKYYDTQEGDYLRLILETIKQNKSFTTAEYEEIQKKIIILDLSMNTKDFEQQFARTLSLSDNTLVFANFSKQANVNNLVILRKFLQLRARKIISKRESIYIGQQMTVTNQSLHKYKIIIGCEVSELYSMLELSEMNGEDFVDEFDILIPPLEQERSEQVYVTTQYLLRSIFGNEETTRYIKERELSSFTEAFVLLAEFKEISVAYFRKYILQAEEGDAAELPYQDLQAQLNDKIGNAKSIIETALANPGFESEDKVEIQDLQELCLLLLKLMQASEMVDYEMQVFQELEERDNAETLSVSPLPAYASEIMAEIQSTHVIETVGIDSCWQFATGLEFIANLFANMAQTDLEFISFLNDDFVLNLCAMVEQRREQLLQDAVEYIAPLYEKSINETKEISLLERHPIEVAISNNRNIILRFLVKVVLPQILELTISITQLRHEFPFYVAINLIMFSFLEEEFCIEGTEDIEKFIEHFMLSVPLDTESELNYEFASLLKSIFSENSEFYCKFEENQSIERLTDHLPTIVELSSELQCAWVRVSSLSFNSIVNETLGWFLKYHSVFIEIVKCRNIFAAIVLFWYYNCDSFASIVGKINFSALTHPVEMQEIVEEEAEENEELNEDNEVDDGLEQLQMEHSERISVLLCNELKEEHLTSLPKILEDPTPDVLFAVLLLCNTLEPQLLNTNVELYLHLMHGSISVEGVLSYDAVQETVVPNATRCNTGVLRRCALTPYIERERIMSKFQVDVQRSYELLLNILSLDEYAQHANRRPFISVQLFEIAEIFYGIEEEYSKFIHEVQRLMASEDYDPEKHYAYVQRLGVPPDSVIILYYDEGIDISSIINFVFYNCDLPIFENIMLKFVANFNHNINKDQIFVINIDVNTTEDLESLLSYFITKSTIYRYHLAMPVFITIPVSKNEDYNVEFIAKCIGEIISLTQPYICYVQHPSTFDGSFRHSTSLLMMQQFENQQLKYKQLQKLEPEMLIYLIAASIARLSFNIHDNEIRETISAFKGNSNLSETHELYIAQNIEHIAHQIDYDDIITTILRIFLTETVKSKIISETFEESSDHSFEAEKVDVDVTENIEVEEQENCDDEDFENWSEWDDASEEGEEQIEEGEDELAIQTVNDEQSLFSNVVLQLNLFESEINILNIANLEELNVNFVKDMRKRERKIVIKSRKGEIVQLATTFKQRDSVYELISNVLSLVDDTFENKKSEIRNFFNSRAMRGTAYNQVSRTKEEYPKLLESYLALLRNHVNYDSEMALTSPQLLFENLVSEQVNLELNAIEGTRTFGIFQNKWIFSTEAYRHIIEEMMVFLKFKEAFLRNVCIERLKPIILVEQEDHFLTVENKEVKITLPNSVTMLGEGQPQEEIEVYHTIFREVFLHNAAYDAILHRMVEQSPESRAGYATILDAYIYISEADDEIENCTLKNHQRIDFRIAGTKYGDAFLRVDGDNIEGDVWIGLE